MPNEVFAVLGLALLDSINPSALVITILLLFAGGPVVRRVGIYLAGVSSAYFTLGLILMLGLDLLSVFGEILDNPVVYALQLAIGAGMLIYAIKAPSDVEPESLPTIPGMNKSWALFGLGMTVTITEAPTAFPLLGATGVMTASDMSAGLWFPLLIVYNIIFILPPLGLLAMHQILGRRSRDMLERLQQRLLRGARETMLWVIGIVGFGLLADALGYFAQRLGLS